MKRSIAAVMAILVLLVSLLCACKKDDTKTNADTTGEAQTSTDGQIIELTAHLLGSNTRVKVGMTTINDFTIKY